MTTPDMRLEQSGLCRKVQRGVSGVREDARQVLGWLGVKDSRPRTNDS